MNPHLSIAQVLSEMEAQIAQHESQEAFHAQQEVLHRDQRALHAEALDKMRERYETLKAAVTAAAEVVQIQPPAAPSVIEDIGGDRRLSLNKLVGRLVASKGQDETFTPTAVAQELNERFATKLRHPVDGRAVSGPLRRLLAAGQLRLVQKGGAVHEAVYGPPARS
jgi:hypothetical protein